VQQLLGHIQAVRSRLQPHVRRWAAEPFARADELVRKGEDALVRERTGEAAVSLKEALAQLESLAAKEGEAFDDALARGNAAIGAGDAAAAREALEVALAIRSDDSAAQAAMARAEALPEVAALLEEGRREELDGRWEAARGAYTQALQRDPAQAEAREGVARMSEKIEDAEVRLLVTRGLSAFTAGRLDAAARDFQAALRLRPGDVEARRALAQTREEQLVVAVRRHLEIARADEAAEQWGAAVVAWEGALKLDANLAEASEGLERARTRQLLDERLGELLGDATRLYDRDALARAEKTLVALRDITPKGPKLSQQEADLARRVQVAATPLTVFFESDGLTEVTIQREKRLGTLQTSKVRLRPGTYVVLGARKGYRDVRRTVRVEPGAPPPRVVVKCEQPI
jgi:tetratricopeptide (TPR) repeat protein